jgi:hypothetical protein
VQQRVAEFVDQSLDGRCRGDVRTHRDLLAREVVVAVLTPPTVADHLEPSGVRLRDERVPHALGNVGVEEFGPDRDQVRQLVAFRLRDVEDVHDSKSSDLLEALLFTVIVFDLRLVLAQSEDGDALLLCR